MSLQYERLALDPIKLGELLWPHVYFYDKQRDIIYSVVDNDRTVVPAGHMLGKDFVAAFIVLWFFLTRSPCRIITTSADFNQLESVLWGELRNFIQTSKYPLESSSGGPLLINHLHIRRMIKGKPCSLSYIRGRVAAKGEGMQGHHIAETGDALPRTLYLADEASGVDDESFNAAESWAKRTLIIGNPYPCSNLFYRSVAEGDVKANPSIIIGRPIQPPPPPTPSAPPTPPAQPMPSGPLPNPFTKGGRKGKGAKGGKADKADKADKAVGKMGPLDKDPTPAPTPTLPPLRGMARAATPTRPEMLIVEPEDRYYQKVIRIRAEDSPNVQLGLAQLRAGLPVTGRLANGQLVVPGVLPYEDYVKRMQTWDEVRRCVGLEAMFYQGAEALLYPALWLNRAELAHELLKGRIRIATGIGVDSAQGGDNTAMAAVDDLGLIELVSHRTADTSVIVGEVVAFARRHGLLNKPDRWAFDVAGGGKQHADRLRNMGYAVRTIAFGESPGVAMDLNTIRQKRSRTQRREHVEAKVTYYNRRAQMYGIVRNLLDPTNEVAFALPHGPEPYNELRRQMSLIPLLYDEKGRLYLPPKYKRTFRRSPVRSLFEILGRSPDEADALVLAVAATETAEVVVRKVGSLWAAFGGK